jgi:hypothetical protein
MPVLLRTSVESQPHFQCHKYCATSVQLKYGKRLMISRQCWIEWCEFRCGSGDYSDILHVSSGFVGEFRAGE